MKYKLTVESQLVVDEMYKPCNIFKYIIDDK